MGIKEDFSTLIAEIQGRGYTLRQISGELGIKERTFYRWLDPDEDEEIIKITPNIIRSLSWLLETTSQNVATGLGYGFLYDADRHQDRVHEISLFPLVAGRAKNADIEHAVDYFLRGRQSQREGDLMLAKRWFENGIGFALAGGEPLLAIYGQLFFGNLLRMLGMVVEAEREFVLAGKAALDYVAQRSANKLHQKQIQNAKRLAARADAYLLITDWSRGNLMNVITHAPKVLEKLRTLEDYSFLPHMYYFLARAWSNLEQPLEALKYAEQGLEAARRLDASFYKQHELFLDQPKGSGYQFRVERLLDLQTDLYILSGMYRDAEDTYLSMRLPKNPATSWSLHTWLDAGWQDYLQHRRHLLTGREAIDSNLDATHELWRNELARSGTSHSEAIAAFHFGRTLFARHQLDAAEINLRQALRIAGDAKAEFTAVMSAIEVIHVYAERHQSGDRELAIDLVNMLYGKVDALRIPMLTEKYKNAGEVASSIR